MDSIFIWMVAGATISLLGIFLIASERELKSKRQEVEELKDKLAESPVRENSTALTDVYPQENGTSAELVARNEALLQQVSSLSKKLETSESKLEQLETLRAHLNGKESENAELRADRERLQAELSTLKTRIASNEPRPSEANWNSERETKITELKLQLEASEAKLHDLESAREQVDDVESRRKDFEELQRSLEASTLQLQNALAAEQENRKALEATRMQLSDTEQHYQASSAANLRLREENSRLQQQLGQNQRQAERLEILRQRLEELRLKQAEISQQDRVIQEEIIALSQLLDVVPQFSTQSESPKVTDYDRRNILDLMAKAPIDMENGDVIQRSPFGASNSEPHASHDNGLDKTNGIPSEPQHHSSANFSATVADGTQVNNEFSRSQPKKKRRFGIFPAAMGVLVVSGVLAAGYLGKDSEPKPPVAHIPRPSLQQRTVKLETLPNAAAPSPIDTELGHKLAEPVNKGNQSADIAGKPEPAILQEPVDSRIAKKSEKTTAGTTGSEKHLSTRSESYEIVQPTRVFSAPNEHAQLIANIEPGTQVNVVDTRNGWLEIRSKYGRPPGFIPKAAAIRIGQN
jgi:hypothetical protein